MPILRFAATAYGRASYGLPETRLVNMVVEPAGPAYEDARLPRPGLVSTYTWGDGPNRGLHQSPGAFSSHLFALSGTELYKNGSDLGDIPGTDLARFANSSDELVIVADGIAYLYDGTTLGAISDPDLPAGVIDVAYLAGRFIYATEDTDRYYYSEVNDAGNIDGLNFTSAEGSPDPIVGLQAVADELFIFGQSTVEVHDKTGDADEPFQRSGSKQYQVGCASRDSIVALDNTVLWCGNDNVVYRAANVPQRISTHGIEAALKARTSAPVAYRMEFEGHKLYALNVPGVGSYAYDVASQQWCELQSLNRTTFRGRTSAIVDGVTYLGDDTTDAIWAMTVGAYLDGTSPVTFLASAFLPVQSGRPRCDNVLVQGARGVSDVTGTYDDALTELRWSDDQGRTWSDWRSAPLGEVGEYGRPPVWRRCGLMKAPGRLFELRTTDAVLATMGHLVVNEGRWNA